jgi:uncharacterized coiled-coil DUF342 family protein
MPSGSSTTSSSSSSSGSTSSSSAQTATFSHTSIEQKHNLEEKMLHLPDAAAEETDEIGRIAQKLDSCKKSIKRCKKNLEKAKAKCNSGDIISCEEQLKKLEAKAKGLLRQLHESINKLEETKAELGQLSSTLKAFGEAKTTILVCRQQPILPIHAKSEVKPADRASSKPAPTATARSSGRSSTPSAGRATSMRSTGATRKPATMNANDPLTKLVAAILTSKISKTSDNCTIGTENFRMSLHLEKGPTRDSEQKFTLHLRGEGCTDYRISGSGECEIRNEMERIKTEIETEQKISRLDSKIESMQNEVDDLEMNANFAKISAKRLRERFGSESTETKEAKSTARYMKNEFVTLRDNLSKLKQERETLSYSL